MTAAVSADYCHQLQQHSLQQHTFSVQKAHGINGADVLSHAGMRHRESSCKDKARMCMSASQQQLDGITSAGLEAGAAKPYTDDSCMRFSAYGQDTKQAECLHGNRASSTRSFCMRRSSSKDGQGSVMIVAYPAAAEGAKSQRQYLIINLLAHGFVVGWVQRLTVPPDAGT